METHEEMAAIVATMVAIVILLWWGRELKYGGEFEWLKAMNKEYPTFVAGWILGRLISIIVPSLLVFRFVRHYLKPKPPPEKVYEKLVDTYTWLYPADGREKLNIKIEEYMNQGFTREEAIQKVDRFLKKYRFEAPEAPKKGYEKLVDVYTRIYGADGKKKLDSDIEAHIKQGLTREEAIQKVDRLLKKYGFD